MHKFQFYKYQLILLFTFAFFMVPYMLFTYHNVAIKQPKQITHSYFGLRDSHDIQWQAFRNNLPLMIILAFMWYMIGSRPYSYILGSAIVIVSFRGDCILYFFVLGFYYLVCTSLYSYRNFEVLIWILMILTLFLNEYCNRFRFLSDEIEKYIFMDWFKNKNHIIHWASILNMSMLKLLSFGVDNHRNYFNKQYLQKHQQKCKKCSKLNPCLKARDSYPPPTININNFLNYILFPGTLLAGPPISYNNYHSFRLVQNKSHNPTFRFLITLISFQIYQYLCPVCIPNPQNSLFQLQMISLFNLVFIWFKFLNIWRWAKVWSYYQGIEVVDNISRCIFNNYGFEGFWRMWHRGFNLWLIRYLYVPLGGNKHIYSYGFVFLFVAFWHDTELKLLYWALVILMFIVPEIYIKNKFRRQYGYLFKYQWFKYTCAILSSIYIYIMCIANLIGFGFGTQHLKIVLIKIIDQWHITLVSICVTSVGVLLMFYKRNSQKEDIGY